MLKEEKKLREFAGRTMDRAWVLRHIRDLVWAVREDAVVRVAKLGTLDVRMVDVIAAIRGKN